MILKKLFLAFFIPGLIGFDSGPSTIPLMQKEVVDHDQMMTLTEYSSVIAIGNIFPGPIVTKLAGYIGYELAGMLVAVIAILL